MDRQMISVLAHADHPIAAPLEDSAVERLLDAAVRRGDERLLDLGCGGGEWLVRALERHPGVRAEGVDVSAAALERARGRAEGAGVGDRLTLHLVEGDEFRDPAGFDVVLCVGATHAFGGLRGTLGVARTHLASGGTVVVGDAYWQAPPSAWAREMLGEYEDLAGTVDCVVAEGWVPVYAHVSSRAELDEYEWRWTGSLSRWALDHADSPDAGAALSAAAQHRTEWLRGYRDSFGFLTAVVRPAA